MNSVKHATTGHTTIRGVSVDVVVGNKGLASLTMSYVPIAVWRPSGNPLPSAVDMMGGFLGMAAMAAGGAPLPPGLDFDGFNFPVPLL